MYFLNKGKKALEEKKKSGIVSSEEDRGILEKLLEIDEDIALVMTMDSIIAGVDTTGTGVFNLMYNLALHPEKQGILRKEIMKILPNPEISLSSEIMREMPFLRACIKESARCNPFFDNIRSAGRDMVIQGYQIPKRVSLKLDLKSFLSLIWILFSDQHYHGHEYFAEE